jgi:hypothetical protein
MMSPVQSKHRALTQNFTRPNAMEFRALEERPESTR